MEKIKNLIELENDFSGKEGAFSFDVFVKYLENKYGVVSECIKDSNNDMKCIYCQDSFMKDVFNFFPDRLCIDVTHCMVADIFMYIFLCEDSNGRNEIVAVGFSTSDNSESFLWLLNTFKKHNPNWRKTKILTLDPEIKYKDVVRTVFPTPYAIICFHHALKSFNKGVESIRIQNMIPNDQIKCAVDLFKTAFCEKELKQKKWNFKSKVLDGPHINYAYLCRIICDSKESIIDWLRQMELICTSMLCPTCGCAMTLKLVPRLSDGAVWVCSNDMEKKQNCSRRCSVRRGSWFELTNMSFEQILTFCYMWINSYSQGQIISETGISTATYISWNKLNRRVCEEYLTENTSYSSTTKMDSSGYAQVLDAWLEKRANEDTFLKFLQDANAMHRKDSAKHSVW
nr:uncharacterized protein LOC107455897 isoform X2 [Parasteatoda tepidariorum]